MIDMSSPLQSTDSAAFREALSQTPTPVFIVATRGPAGTGGFTASSVTSVSDDPPTMLVCINKRNARLDAFLGNPRFSINLLTGADASLAQRFAGAMKDKPQDRFRPQDWDRFASGCPRLPKAVFSLECRLATARPEATHMLLFGHVEDIRTAPGNAQEALVYHRRAYCRI